jgi:hypothetical protein
MPFILPYTIQNGSNVGGWKGLVMGQPEVLLRDDPNDEPNGEYRAAFPSKSGGLQEQLGNVDAV